MCFYAHFIVSVDAAWSTMKVALLFYTLLMGIESLSCPLEKGQNVVCQFHLTYEGRVNQIFFSCTSNIISWKNNRILLWILLRAVNQIIEWNNIFKMSFYKIRGLVSAVFFGTWEPTDFWKAQNGTHRFWGKESAFLLAFKFIKMVMTNWLKFLTFPMKIILEMKFLYEWPSVKLNFTSLIEFQLRIQ